MAEAGHAYAEDFARSTGTDNTAWVDGATIAAGSLVAGRKYLIVAMGNHSNGITGQECRVRVIRGSTVLCDAQNHAARARTTTTARPFFGFATVDTQPGTAEAIKVQIQPSSTTAHTVDSQVFVLALNDLVDGTDYHFAEKTADETLPTTLAVSAGPTITFTPNGTDKYLVLGMSIIDVGVATVSYEMSLFDSVEALDQPLLIQEGINVIEKRAHLLSRVFQPSAAAHTFEIRYRQASGTAGVVLYSAIFALRLNAFAEHAENYNVAEVAPAASPTWTNLATVAPNPTVTGDWFTLAFAIRDINSLGETDQVRLQIDPSGGGLASNPAYGDDAPHDGDANDATNEIQTLLMKSLALTSGAGRTINYDATRISASTVPRYEDRQLVAFSLELPSGPGSGPRRRRQMLRRGRSARGVFAR